MRLTSTNPPANVPEALPARLGIGSFAVLYAFLALITGWLSFYARPLDVGVAAHLQQSIWTELGSRGLPAGNVDPLLRIHASRILFPALMQPLIVAGASVEQAFALLRLITVFAVYTLFHRFLNIWFRDELALCGTLFVAATVPLTFNNYFEIPTDFPEIAVFTAGMWAMVRRQYVILGAVVAIGTLNRESTAVLPFLLFFILAQRDSFTWLWKVAGVGLAWLVPLVSLRLWTVGDLASPHSDSMAHNLPGLAALLTNPHPYNNYLFWMYLFGAFWVLPYVRWRSQPVFFRRALVALPAVVLVYALAGGFLNEPRELVNLYPILVPAGLFALFGVQPKEVL